MGTMAQLEILVGLIVMILISLFGTNITPKKNDELIFDNKKVKLVCNSFEKK